MSLCRSCHNETHHELVIDKEDSVFDKELNNTFAMYLETEWKLQEQDFPVTRNFVLKIIELTLLNDIMQILDEQTLQ